MSLKHRILRYAQDENLRNQERATMPPLSGHLVPSLGSRIAALPIRAIDWMLRKAFRL